MATPLVARAARTTARWSVYAAAAILTSVGLLCGCSTTTSPSSGAPASQSSGGAAVEGAGPPGTLGALVPLTPPGLVFDSTGTAGISTNEFQQLGLESWYGVVGCNATDDPAVTGYAAFDFTDAQTNRHGAASVFLYQLADAQAGAAWYAACNDSATNTFTTRAIDGVTAHSAQTDTGPVASAMVGNTYIFVSGSQFGVDRSSTLFRMIVANAAKGAKTSS